MKHVAIEIWEENLKPGICQIAYLYNVRLTDVVWRKALDLGIAAVRRSKNGISTLEALEPCRAFLAGLKK